MVRAATVGQVSDLPVPGVSDSVDHFMVRLEKMEQASRGGLNWQVADLPYNGCYD